MVGKRRIKHPKKSTLKSIVEEIHGCIEYKWGDKDEYDYLPDFLEC
ncbi:MAG: hypothetical protein F7C35_03235 [Desulfurococcales archaeon]|nr:hypothetical protein [Desulfurococcales archaeon]